MDKLTLTVREAAVLLGISRGLAYEMVRIGKIPSVRMGKRVLIPQGALQRLVTPIRKAGTRALRT